MSADLRINRVDEEVAGWQSKEDSLKRLFKSSSSIDNSLLKEKLKFYESILLKHKETKMLDERLTLQIIKNERNNLIKQIYPTALKRYFYKIVRSSITAKINSSVHVKDIELNNRSLSEKLERFGFKDTSSRVERYMKLGLTKFTVPVSYYVNEKERLDHSLFFAKNEQGHYQFEGFRTGLYNESNPKESKEHNFNDDHQHIFNAKEAYNLLSGRAVMKEGIWKQFDLDDKDAQGNYKIKEFPSVYGYSVEKVIDGLPLDGWDR